METRSVATRRNGRERSALLRRLRDLSPLRRSSRIRSMSTFSTALPALPGPSKRTGSCSKRGSDRNAAQPRAPISPSPGGAWRSRFEPSFVCESFMWRLRRRDLPTVRSPRSSTSVSLSAVVMSNPLANMWQESRQMPMRLSPPARSTSSRSSSKERPTVLPAPAVFSSSSRQRFDSASACLTISPTRGSASSCGSPTVEPGWTTTPSALISSPIRSAWISESADFLRIPCPWWPG